MSLLHPLGRIAPASLSKILFKGHLCDLFFAEPGFDKCRDVLFRRPTVSLSFLFRDTLWG